jgi:hypothetical protein
MAIADLVLAHKERSLRQLVAQRAIYVEQPHTRPLEAGLPQQWADPWHTGVHEQHKAQHQRPCTELALLLARLFALRYVLASALHNLLRIVHKHVVRSLV